MATQKNMINHQRIATEHSLKAIIVGKAIYQTTLQANVKCTILT